MSPFIATLSQGRETVNSLGVGGCAASDDVSGSRSESVIRLSICIPTYNRAAFIGETLESILSQVSNVVEVVIVDGASTDNTEQVVSPFRDRFPNLVYHRGITNRGVDRDMATAVEIARGQFCWLMSSDDLLKPRAISQVLDEISTGDDIYLCDVTLCDYNMKPIRNTSLLSSCRETNRYDLADRAQLLRYFSLATSNNALFCYMSSIIFRRESWVNIGYENLFSGTGYAHVFMLLSFIKTRCLIKYIPIPLVLNRAGNDSFSNQGIAKRYLLDFDGYLLLANQLFNDDLQVRRSFLHVMTREHPWCRLIKLRSEIRSPERWGEICMKLLEFGYSRNQVALCGVLGQARFIVRLALYLNRKFPGSTFLRWLRRTA